MAPRTRGLVLFTTVAALVLVSGGVHGVLTNRWQQSDALDRGVSRLTGVPAAVGDWRSEEVPHDAHDLERAGIRGCVYRKYTHDRSGASVSVLLVCGKGGPISVHTPDVCYAGNGYRQSAPQARMTGGDRAALWSAPFEKPDVLTPQRLTVTWGWSHDGSEWVAPDNPRSVCAWQPALYKLYVVRSVPPATSGADTVVQDFLADFLPPLRAALSPTP